jgi:WXG100 family type VII secretion target
MAGNQIRVNTDDMQTAAGNFGTHASNLGDLIDRVTQVVSGLGDSWNSNASMSFTDFMSQWNKTASQMHEHLHTVSTNVKTAGTNYSDTDNAIKQGFTI